MFSPDTRVRKDMQLIARQFPSFTEWLVAWNMHELEQLPDVVSNTGIAQGRCKVLKELTKAFSEAPGWTI